MVMQVPLTQGHFALVDDEDFDRVVAVGKWSASDKPKAKTVYAVRGTYRADGRATTERLHNFITGWPFVDHINGDGLDNTRVNLRAANKSQNGCNRGMTATNTSGYKGVTWHKRGKKWLAQLSSRGVHVYLGLFTDPMEAAAAYDAAAIEYFGEFARLNFPEEKAA